MPVFTSKTSPCRYCLAINPNHLKFLVRAISKNLVQSTLFKCYAPPGCFCLTQKGWPVPWWCICPLISLAIYNTLFDWKPCLALDCKEVAPGWAGFLNFYWFPLYFIAGSFVAIAGRVNFSCGGFDEFYYQKAIIWISKKFDCAWKVFQKWLVSFWHFHRQQALIRQFFW